ncbi:hypothetical protein E5332_05705 [Enterorhabdus sp. NM05_H27]|nr:hypothetical protein E5332_05705 [Enterorhabdus sp. NM05_H27]
MRPSERFGGCEEALEALCRGCPCERGWIDGGRAWGPMCRAMAAIMADGDGSVARDGEGRVRCAKRMEAEERKRSAELAKYRRRMKGDWT